MNKELLETRLSIIMIREDKNFLTSFTEFRYLLNKYFKFDYSLDEIENALYNMEEKLIVNAAKEESKISSIVIQEIEEDNFNN